MKGKILLAALLAVNVAHAKPTAVAQIGMNSIQTKIETPTTIGSAHLIQITNDLSTPQLFTWTMTLCPETQKSRCITQQDHLTLYKGQSFKKVYQLSEVIVFHAIGTKTISAKTEITGAATAQAFDSKWVDVFY